MEANKKKTEIRTDESRDQTLIVIDLRIKLFPLKNQE